MSPARW